MHFKVDDRIEREDGTRGDVRQVSKDGKRVRVLYYVLNGPFAGKRYIVWDDASAWKLVRSRNKVS
jgi:hypothetical protein